LELAVSVVDYGPKGVVVLLRAHSIAGSTVPFASSRLRPELSGFSPP